MYHFVLQENLIKEEVIITSRVHSMIIGRRGAGIRKIMQDFNVDIKMPRERDPEPDLVVIMGNDEDNVLDCKVNIFFKEYHLVGAIPHMSKIAVPLLDVMANSPW